MISNDNNWPFPPAQPLPPRTVHGVIWSKVLDALEEVSLGTVGRFTAAVAATVVLTYCLNYAPEAGRLLLHAITFADSIVLKGTVAAALVASHRKIFAAVVAVCTRPTPATPSVPTIDGIPISELLDHLFEHESFKRDEIEAKFGIPRNRSDALGRKFDELGITIRNRFRARILNPELSRQDVAAMLEGKTTAAELQPYTLKKVGQNTLSTRATGREIEERVAAALPSFTLRRIPRSE